jgi:hypothetical protein
MNNIKLFESNKIRSAWDEKAQKWFFAIVDVVSALDKRMRGIAVRQDLTDVWKIVVPQPVVNMRY